MMTLLFGLTLVVASAALFGRALFGRRPVPQPAMSLPGPALVGDGAETAPSGRPAGARVRLQRDRRAADLGGVLEVPWWRRMLQREPSADHQPSADVTLSGSTRARSGALLALIIAGMAVTIGAVMSLLVVLVVLLIT